MKKIILAAFIGIGSFAIAQQTPKKELTPEQKAEWLAKKEDMKKKRAEMKENKMQEMIKSLGLNDEQVSKIRALDERRLSEFEKSRIEMEARRKEMKQRREEMNAEMKTILTPEQFSKWEADKKAKMEKRKNTMKERKMKKDGQKIHKAKPTAKIS